MIDQIRPILDILMFVALAACLMSGAPVGFTLAGVAMLFAALGLVFGVFDIGFLLAYPQRVFGTMSNEALTAVPLFILMGVILERSRIAEDLLQTMADMFGKTRGGLLYATSIVGALLAASTGVVGATVVTMGLLALPAMLKRGYSIPLATGSIAAAGTLGQIIPPSVVLILLGDQISVAYQKAQSQGGEIAAKTVSVGDLFAGAVIPGLMLVGLYLIYQASVAWLDPKAAPAGNARIPGLDRILRSLAAPLGLIIAVLGSILGGIATPTEGASVGALGALLLAGQRSYFDAGAGRSWPSRAISFAMLAAFSIAALKVVGIDTRLGRESPSALDLAAISVAAILVGLIAFGVAVAIARLWRDAKLSSALSNAVEVTAMVFLILISAGLFSLVFRGLGGEEWIASLFEHIPGGLTGAMIAVMLVVFLLGFFIDFIEICFVVVPLVATPLLVMGADPVWLGIMFAMNLQTSFLTPPFGFALFYLRGVAPPEVKTIDIYRGVVPFIGLQLIALLLVALFPILATWLPGILYN
jgi:TRAP-type mannitol/chloroaromatic compound transport system permease large subunit